MNPLCHRIIAVFDESGTDQVNFRMFVKAMSVFSRKAKADEKLKFAFTIFDVDQDKRISNEDLFHILKLMCGTNISDESLQKIVDATIDEVGKQGVIKEDGFGTLFNNLNFKSQMTLNF